MAKIVRGQFPSAEGWIVPVHSLGVQGDSRSYAPVLAVNRAADAQAKSEATELVNRIAGINRVMACIASAARVSEMKVRRSAMCGERLGRLRRADAVVRRLSHESGFDQQIW